MKCFIIFLLLYFSTLSSWAKAIEFHPQFNASRYFEDYTYLRYSKNRSDIFDPIKHIPLTENGETYLSFGGETRQHFELIKNDDWGATREDTNGHYLQRYMFHGDLHFGKSTRVFPQIKSAIESGRLAGPRGVDENKMDLHQAFIDRQWHFNNNRNLTLRVGRQEMFYGSRRFINYRERPNVRLSFDGVKLIWNEDPWTVSAFATKAVEVNPGKFDDNFIDGPSLWGLYAAHKKPTWIHGNFDLYYFGLK